MTVLRDQVINLFKALSEIINKFLALLITMIAAIYSDTGNDLFMKHHKLMMFLVLTIVLYFFLVIIGTILQPYNRNFVPIIICTMLMMGSAVSVLALSIISPTIAWITLALWVGMFIFVAYFCSLYEKIKNWIEGHIARSSSRLLPH
ncbi:hypothetical protein RIF29_26769 [Crotalaria pallida]|uniref:Uncharacterized protein n=1 Tax=Crotalaria pallida TaxID=3830 RepID=A0AAN9I514_CROPI